MLWFFIETTHPIIFRLRSCVDQSSQQKLLLSRKKHRNITVIYFLRRSTHHVNHRIFFDLRSSGVWSSQRTCLFIRQKDRKFRATTRGIWDVNSYKLMELCFTSTTHRIILDWYCSVDRSSQQKCLFSRQKNRKFWARIGGIWEVILFLIIVAHHFPNPGIFYW